MYLSAIVLIIKFVDLMPACVGIWSGELLNPAHPGSDILLRQSIIFMTAKLIVHKEIIVKGRVQGVGFRANAKHVADLLGVQGQIKNLADKSVWIVAEAEEDVMNDFLVWCRKGPAFSQVRELEVISGNVQHYNGFTILHI
jgi:acylphosphatase